MTAPLRRIQLFSPHVAAPGWSPGQVLPQEGPLALQTTSSVTAARQAPAQTILRPSGTYVVLRSLDWQKYHPEPVASLRSAPCAPALPSLAGREPSALLLLLLLPVTRQPNHITLSSCAQLGAPAPAGFLSHREHAFNTHGKTTDMQVRALKRILRTPAKTEFRSAFVGTNRSPPTRTEF